jgi:ribulose-phosphate 3-epimerase
MDGVFVPNLTFGPMVVEAVDRMTDLELDGHLMIVKPERYLETFLNAGLDWISFHAEAVEDAGHCIEVIKGRKKKVGLAISPGTPLDQITPFLERLDFLLIMTVNPGFYGQQFMHDILGKIREAKAWIVSHDLSCLIQVDGGINHENVQAVAAAGADIVVAGAGVFKNHDYKRAIEQLRCSKP